MPGFPSCDLDPHSVNSSAGCSVVERGASPPCWDDGCGRDFLVPSGTDTAQAGGEGNGG